MALSSSRGSSSSLRYLLTHPTPGRSFFTASLWSEKYYNPWSTKNHLKPPVSIPHPLPAIYPQKIVLSDGSTFTSYSTAPTPANIRLTRDVTNNPLFKPGLDRRGMGEDGEGRVGKFRRRFEGLPLESESVGEAGLEEKEEQAGLGVGRREISFGEVDLEWMGEGAREEAAPKVPEYRKGGAKGGKKK